MPTESEPKNMEYDLIALGETMVALAPPPGESVRRAARWLVDHAGAESNTCVGLARLGLRVAWVSHLGDDAAGERILDALASEHVETRWVHRDATRPTGLMIKDPDAGVRYYRTGSAASVMGPDVLGGVPVGDARAVLVTGITALIGDAPHAAGIALLDEARGLRIVDPNFRKSLWGSARRAELVRPFVERCDLLLAGVGELEELLLNTPGGSAGPGRSGGSATEALARRAADLGPREVIVRGATTVGALESGSWTEIQIQRGAAIDPIGAGDAFNAGYIAARLRGDGVDAALRAGIHCGTAVTTAMSDTAAFPKRGG
jgi:2-dehydro-3-deoxygluconokinase